MAECSGTSAMKQKCDNHESCMELIQTVLDGSATEEEMAQMKHKLSECMPCIEGYELEKKIKESLQVKVEKVCCPQSTVNFLKSKIGIPLAIILGILIEMHVFHCLVLS